MRAWILLAIAAGLVLALPQIRAQLVGGGDDAADADAGAGAADPGAAVGLGAFIDAIGARVRVAWSLPANPYVDEIARAEVKFSLPSGLLGRILWQESRFRPDIIDGTTPSSAGALGIAQFMPATAAELGIDPLDPHQAIPAAAKYLRGLYNALGDWQLAIAAYNWGQGNVTRYGLAGAPLETRNYVRDVAGDVGLA